MKQLLVILCLFFAATAGGQSIDELQKQLQEAKTNQEKVVLYYRLGEAQLMLDADASIDNARKAYDLATRTGDKATAAYAAYLASEGYARKRKSERQQEEWLTNAFARAKEAGDLDMVIKSISKRSEIAVKSYDHRRAYQIHQEAFQYLSQQGLSANELKRKIEAEKAALDREKEELQQQKETLEAEVSGLASEKDRLNEENATLTTQQQKLSKAKQRAEQEVAQKEEELKNVSKQKQKAEEIAEQRSEEIQQLSRKELEQRALLSEAQLDIERSNNLRNITVLAAAFLFVLSMLIYNRYRSSRKAKVALEEKNKIIEQERERSDELLLNILPAPIANELKEFGKAKARRYEEVTVLFTDFQNFSRISEQLTPEELVKELDNCFKAFDFIISQYADIEKIKTVGDAYLCASGLSEESEPPVNIIRAAQEMQQFLEEQKQEKRRLNRPYFEARIGLHTGPVVAGVVGVNKFAYDIWGDTVNIAARMESNSEAGKINISASTYDLIKEVYECEHRGKMHAKNKGMIDMYFVKKAFVPVTV